MGARAFDTNEGWGKGMHVFSGLQKFHVYDVGDWLVHHRLDGEIMIWDAGAPEGKPEHILYASVAALFSSRGSEGRFTRIAADGPFVDFMAWLSFTQREEYRAGHKAGVTEGREEAQRTMREALGVGHDLLPLREEVMQQIDRVSDRVDRLEIDKGWTR